MSATPAELMSVMVDIREALERLNGIEDRLGFPPLEENNFSWKQRQHELSVRLDRIDLMIAEYGRPTQAILDALGAWIVALKIALAREDNLRIETGAAA